LAVRGGLASVLLCQLAMAHFVLSRRRIVISIAVAAVLLAISARADAQGIGFQGGVTVDPEQAFVGTHFETGELFQNFRFRPGIDGGFGGDFSLAALNIEFLYHFQVGRSWSLYQGGGPAVVFVRQNDRTSTHAGSFITFGFAHENGFFTDFKLGTGSVPTLKFGVGFTVRKRVP
jgi:hypothetical protein